MKKALVTGSSSGIGRAIATRLAQDGYEITIHYNTNLEGAEETLSIINKISSAKNNLLQFNLAEYGQIDSALHDKSYDILINNAGLHRDNSCLMMTTEDFDIVLKTNLSGPFYLSQICAKEMLYKRTGIIVNIASISGQVGNPGQANYSASKAGLIALTRSMAKELSPKGLRINCVSPGYIKTAMTESLDSATKLMIPMRRFGNADEVANVVSFLCSEDSSYVNGEVISVNGALLTI